MKYLCILLSFYVLMATGMPCMDEDEAVVNSVSTTQHSDNTNHDNESCSPFCICNCCGCSGFSIPLSFLVKGIIINATQLKIAEYQALVTDDFIAAIWQPPRRG
ncbi:MAG: hypothetical protein NTX03_10620 [Bacteroidetes bacterium]|nr:hypothetical protein [Bacteroidota bacterium]